MRMPAGALDLAADKRRGSETTLQRRPGQVGNSLRRAGGAKETRATSGVTQLPEGSPTKEKGSCEE